MKSLQTLFGLLSLMAVASARTCTTPLGDAGQCVSLKYCPEVVTLFTKLPTERAKQYSSLLQHLCGSQTTRENYPVVCCKKVVLDGSGKGIPTATTESIYVILHPEYSTESTTPQQDRSVSTSSTTESSATCHGPANEQGFCKPLEDCLELLDSLKKNPNDEVLKTYLRSSNKICGSTKTNVCCPVNSPAITQPRNQEPSKDNAPQHPSTEEEGCGLVQQHLTKVVGGEDSHVGDWPWMALIGYDPYSLVPFKCGGALVSARHVITAAHCIRKDLSFVRLGEYDLSSPSDPPAVDIDVDKAVGHPDFGRDGRHDIAVLYLVKNVQFSDRIRPICLPISNHWRTKNLTYSNPFVAGWGRTMEGGSGSHILQQLQIPVLENSECERIYRSQGKLMSEQQFDDSVLCAGILAGGRDTCQGDSGGPLMLPEPFKGTTRYYLIGVVSYGIGCARVGIPGAYTRVRHFVNWIEDKIAET